MFWEEEVVIVVVGGEELKFEEFLRGISIGEGGEEENMDWLC